MILSIDAQRYVKPVKVGGWNKGETWFGYFVYSFAEIKRTFKPGYSLRDCLNEVFSYGCDGPGQAFFMLASIAFGCIGDLSLLASTGALIFNSRFSPFSTPSYWRGF